VTRFAYTRRALLGAIAAGTPIALAASSVGRFLPGVAPLSGGVWRKRRTVPKRVDGGYGSAEVTYDDRHVPHVVAEDELAAYFALGYVHASDRSFQMDLLRRRAAGDLAGAFGPSALGNDRLKRRLGFRAAAEASIAAIQGTRTHEVLVAYSDGVSAALTRGAVGPLFGLFGVAPEPWTPVDSALVIQGLAWRLNGRGGLVWPLIRALRQQELTGLDPALRRRLFGRRIDHGAPIDRASASTAGDVSVPTWDDASATGAVGTDAPSGKGPTPAETRVSRGLVEDVVGVLPPAPGGSNAVTVAGDHTASGDPILANDPHLTMTAPPIWYQQRVTVAGRSIRGATVPGLPVPAVGETDATAWGITNAPVDASTVYTYETRGDGADAEYRYRGEWRPFRTTETSIPVNGGADRTVTRRETVHGPVVERTVGGETSRVGLSWTGLSGTRTLAAFYRMATAEGPGEFEAGLRRFDLPPLNVHYAAADGETLYRLVGQVPIRRVDGEVVPGGRVFDGSAGEAEVEGYVPYGQSQWDGDGFVPFETLPSVRDESVIVSANQRPTNDPEYPLGNRFARLGYRARRLYDRLDDAVAGDDPVTSERVRRLLLDTVDPRAETLVPALLDARDRLPDGAAPWLDALAEWDGRMDRSSRAALFFELVADHFGTATWDAFFDDDVPDVCRPRAPVELTLPPDSPIFDSDREAVLVEAVERTLDELDGEDWETYGDHNTTDVEHLLGSQLPGLAYPAYPTDGGFHTVRRFSGSFGAGYRFVSRPGGPTHDALAGGNDGTPGADHYSDQLRGWADGRYWRLDPRPRGDPDVVVTGGGES
jgi:penicillin amidase